MSYRDVGYRFQEPPSADHIELQLYNDKGLIEGQCIQTTAYKHNST